MNANLAEVLTARALVRQDYLAARPLVELLIDEYVGILAAQQARTLAAEEICATAYSSDPGPDVPDDVAELLTTEAGLLELFGDPDAPPRRPRERVAAVGALQQWRRELRAGVGGQRPDRPSTWKLDALWRAACWEAAAEEHDRNGMPDAADDARRHAAQLVAKVAA